MSLRVDITKRYPSFNLEVAFDAHDEVVGLLGASGCGKSLTMRCIAGIETPDEGRIEVNGKVFFDSAAKINLSPQQRKTALLFQNYMLFPNLTVEENIGAGIPRNAPAAERAQIIARELKRFDVEPFAKRYPAHLSGGQQQRVALARMLAADPCILMLDEPFSALDSHLKSILEQNLSSLFDAFTGTIVYVSHDIDEALRFCDSIAVMEYGHITEHTKPRALIDRPQTMAGMKLSGVKNTSEVEVVGTHQVYCPQWGITLTTKGEVPPETKAVGFRAVYLQRVDNPNEKDQGPKDLVQHAEEAKENIFHVRADRVTESRFEAAIMLSALDRPEDAQPLVEAGDQEMRFLHQRLSWRISTLHEGRESIPAVGDEFYIHIPAEHIYLVSC